MRYVASSTGWIVPSHRTENNDRGRVDQPFGFTLTDPGVPLSRTRLFPEVTRINLHLVSMGS